MKIIQISDCHLFTDPEKIMADVNTQYSFLKILQHVAVNEAADLLIVTGDIAHDEELVTYQKMKIHLDAINTRYYCVPGNHDQAQAMKMVFADNFSGDYLQIKKDGWNIILLNTAVTGKVYGELKSETLAELSTMLKNNSEPAVIFMHHHPVPIQCPWMDKIALQNPELFLDTLQLNNNIQAVFFGHIHQEFKAIVNNVTFYGTPSTCFQFKPRSQSVEYDKNHPGYRSIILNTNAAIETQVVRVNLNQAHSAHQF